MAETKLKSQTENQNNLPRILSTVALVAVSVLVLALIIFNASTKPPISESIWNEAMTMGETESPKRHYIMYTDIMCPYCDVFTRATIAHADEFDSYLKENKILFEIRMTDTLYYSGVEYSKIAALGSYCAANEGKFWDYYHGAITKLWEDYHSKGIGDSKTSPMITDMTDDWWYSIAGPANLSDEWLNCVKNETVAETLYDSTVKFSKLNQGLPYFDFNGTIYKGLPAYSYDSWDQLKSFLDTGLSNQK